MRHVGWAIAAGLGDWVLRLAFASTVALGALGAYIALLASLAPADPGHDRQLGLLLMGIALGASIVVLILLFALGATEDSGGWYALVYGLFFASLLTLFLMSCGFRLIGDWQRSPVSVPATMSGCESSSDGNGDTDYDCVFSWTWAGVDHVQDLNTSGVFPNGTANTLWVDPSTGGADNHSYVPIVFAFIGAGLVGSGTTVAWVFSLAALAENRDGLRPWLRDRAWWRTLPRRVPPAPPARPVPPPPPPSPPAPALADEISDAVPPWVEDARPPGY